MQKSSKCKISYDVYICSSVQGSWMDPILNINRISLNQKYNVQKFFLLDEKTYRYFSTKKWLCLLSKLSVFFVFPLVLAIKMLFSKKNSIFIITSSPFLLAPFCLLFKKNSKKKIIFLLHDLYPDVLEFCNVIKKGSVISRIMRSISNYAQRNSDAIVFLGKLLSTYSLSGCNRESGVFVIDVGTHVQNFFLEDAIKAPLNIRYGGNLGHMHDWETISECLQFFFKQEELKKKLHFHFFASGVGLKRLKSFLGESESIYVKPIDSRLNWLDESQRFPVSLVSLSPAGALTCFPSKTYDSIALGQAILAICPEWSDLARFIINNKLGWVVNNSPYTWGQVNSMDCCDYSKKLIALKSREAISADFCKILNELVQSPEIIQEKRVNAYKAGSLLYGSKSIGKKWHDVLEYVSL